MNLGIFYLFLWDGVLDESSTSANLENDHEFIIKEYYLHWYVAFWEP